MARNSEAPTADASQAEALWGARVAVARALRRTSAGEDGA